MTVYRCYFLTEQDRIAGFENIPADALDFAVERAIAELRQRPEHRGIEICDGPNLVYGSRPQPATDRRTKLTARTRGST